MCGTVRSEDLKDPDLVERYRKKHKIIIHGNDTNFLDDKGYLHHGTRVQSQQAIKGLSHAALFRSH